MNPILKRVLTALTTATLAVLAIVFAPTSWMQPVFSVLITLVFFEFALLLRRKVPLFSLRGLYGIAFGYFVIAVGLAALPVAAIRHGNLMMLYLIALVKISDMGGFAFGVSTARMMRGGNHKLCPAISPNKSWEGLLGSLLGSCVLSCCFVSVTHFATPKALSFGIVAALIGTFGDLVESKFKRWVGVKDSATFMPAGLGGLLDMFDSLIIAPAVLLPLI